MAIRRPTGGRILAAGLLAVLTATVATATPAAAAPTDRLIGGHFVKESGTAPAGQDVQVSLL
jgi:hypothetical protein